MQPDFLEALFLFVYLLKLSVFWMHCLFVYLLIVFIVKMAWRQFKKNKIANTIEVTLIILIVKTCVIKIKLQITDLKCRAIVV